MEISSASDLKKDTLSSELVTTLERNSDDWNLSETNVYFDFPLYRDDEAGGLISTKVLVVSKHHGVIIFGTSSASDSSVSVLDGDNDALEQVFSNVYARLIKNRKLRKGKQGLSMPIRAAIFAPSLSRKPAHWDVEDTSVAWSERTLEQLFASMAWVLTMNYMLK